MIKQLIKDGIAMQIAAGNEAEKTKSGTLRGGNTGMVNQDGQIIGSCAAQAYLRYKGISTGSVITEEKELMFAGGRANEDLWLASLKQSYTGPILCEEEIPTKWETESGIAVTGRPDIVLCEEQKAMESTNINPVCMIELKQVMSINTAYNIKFKREPQLKHLMQTAHYMWQLDCPGELWYTNRTNFEMPAWMLFRPFPKPNEPNSDYLGYRYYRFGNMNNKTGKPIKHKLTEEQYLSGEFSKTFAEPAKILPFLQGFKLKIHEETGVLSYKDEYDDNSEWVETIVNIPDIIRFYEYVADLEQYGKVPPEALNLTPSGQKMGWKFSDYSDLGDLDVSNHAGKPLKSWLAAIAKSNLGK
jgi:hypothetical protein